MTGAMVLTGTAATLGPEVYWFAMLHPELVNKIFDFLTGFVPYPPSSTPAGYLGFGLSRLLDDIRRLHEMPCQK